jgi:hypothetical protein
MNGECIKGSSIVYVHAALAGAITAAPPAVIT